MNKWLAIFLLATECCLCAAAIPGTRGTSFNLFAALAAAPTNSVIHVPAGVYFGPIFIARSIRLIADDGAVIDGNGQGTVVFIQAPDVELRGFIVRNSGKLLSSEDSGILVTAPHVCVANNRLDHVLFGIYLKQSSEGLVVGNHVRGYDLPQPVRGDGLRLWYSDHCVILSNDVENCRDNILWFSKNDVISGNNFTRDRYGLHLMYDRNLIITNNWLAENFVGAFLMYSENVVFMGNVCLNNRGVSGYGLGIKNIDSMRAVDNRILDNSVGLWINSSASAVSVSNLFSRNVFAYNGTGLVIDPSDRGNAFTENAFMNNSQQVAEDGDGPLEDNEFSLSGIGNYWSDYKGYPSSNTTVGAVPYRVQNLFDSLTDQYQSLQLFRYSPAEEAVDLAAQAFPLIQPQVVLTDTHPLITPPGINATPLPLQKSTSLLVLSLGLLASICMVTGVAEMGERHKKKKTVCSGVHDGPSPLVVVEDLNKSFGRKQVLQKVSFSIRRGQALAFWGGNGAGKSTTIKCILGLLRFQGSIQVGGLDVVRQGKKARRLLGYVPQELSFYSDWTVERTMNFYACIKRVSPVEAHNELVEVGLEAQMAKKVSELSGGMRQRLGLAAALLGSPAVLLLDEFTSNLDADARDALIALLARQRSKGLTILFATHRIEEVQALADEVILMEEGHILQRYDAAKLKEIAAHGRVLKMTLPSAQLEQAEVLLNTAAFKYRRTGENFFVEVNGHGALAPLELLWEGRIQVKEMDLIKRTEITNDAKLFFKS